MAGAEPVVVHLDMTEPDRGIALITGEHGYPESPQARLNLDGDGWTLDDAYGDLDRDGESARDDFTVTDSGTGTEGLKGAARSWLAYLDIDPAAVRFDVGSKYA